MNYNVYIYSEDSNHILSHSGHLFHIDFGKFLGDSQMFGTFKRFVSHVHRYHTLLLSMCYVYRFRLG